MSYSQFDEERYILEHTPAVGLFLDIGAWHPTELSNSRALYERGWAGVLVEPSPGPVRTLLQSLNGDDRLTLVSAAVGPEFSVEPFWVTDKPFSTSRPEVRDKWIVDAEYQGKLYVPTLTISSLSIQFGPFSFVNIDAEGSSTDLFIGMLNSRIEPDCVCVEHEGRLVEIQSQANELGYRIVYTNDVNVVMVK